MKTWILANESFEVPSPPWRPTHVRGPMIFSEGWPEMWLNREIRVQIPMALRKPNFSRRVSKSSFASKSSAKSSRWTFSALLLSVALVTISAGHRDGSNNHGGPFHHCSASFTLPPRLPRSDGFSDVVTCLYCVFGRLWIFLTRLATN